MNPLGDDDLPPYAERKEWQHALFGLGFSIGWIIGQLQCLNRWLSGND